MPPLEKTIVNAILKKLNAMPNTKAIKTHGSQYMEKGTPDIIGCRNGCFFALEVKRSPKHKVTPMQELRITQWTFAGGVVDVVSSMEYLERWLVYFDSVRPRGALFKELYM